MVAANFDPIILEQGNTKKRTLYSERERIRQEVLEAWLPTLEKYDEFVMNLQAATSSTMDARANQTPIEDPNYAVTSELMSKILRTAAGARGNFLIADAETPSMSARVILETLIDITFISKDGTGQTAKRFYYQSLKDFLKRAGEPRGGKYSHLEDALDLAEQELGAFSAWDFVSGRSPNLRRRACKVGMLEGYDGWYRMLSAAVHSSFIGMRQFETEGCYFLGSSAQMMHRPVIMIPLLSLFAFDAYRKGNHITVPDSAYYLRHFAKQNILQIMTAMPNLGVPPNELDVLKQAVQRIPH